MRLSAIAFLCTASIVPAWGQDPPPNPALRPSDIPVSIVPARAATPDALPPGYRVFSEAERTQYLRAFAAADRDDWKTARALAAGNPVVGKLIEWRFLTDRNSTAAFADFDRFLKANPTWPLRETLLTRAEAKIDLESSAAFVLAWYGGREPSGAFGKVCLGAAEIAAGKAAAGAQHIRTGWIEGSFDAATEAEIVKRFSAFLTPDVEAGRLDSLLWRSDIAGARRQLARVDETTRAIGAARLAVKAEARDASALIAALPPELAANSGLRFDRARALRKAGDQAGALAIFEQMSLEGLARAHPQALWVELSAAVRQSLLDGDGRTAYRLVAGAGFSPNAAEGDPANGGGTEYSDAQFLAGWIALRVLHDPATALGHFRNVSAAVSRPISVARGAYWQGRAFEETGDTAHAWAAYKTAAEHAETFYGMLALARIDPAPLMRVRDTPARQAPPGFERDEMVRAMEVLADLKQTGTLRRFALFYRATHGDPAQTRRLLEFLVESGNRPVAVRVAKAAGYEGQQFAAFAYPVIPVPAYTGRGTGPEEALVLALIRQETEFDVGAVSPTGARGLMQVIPSGGKGFAKQAGLGYRPAALTTDATYNMQLGMTMLADYMRRWNNALYLGAAAYNAGPTNARRWVNAFGDPRDGAIDPVDWIERIPFGETRNYVQRVIENVQVYRALLAGKSAPLRILDDLYGTQPHPKPLRRPGK